MLLKAGGRRRHYLSVAQRKPGALRNGAPFLELPDGFRTLRQQLLQRPGGKRLAARDFLRGFPLQPGQRLGTEAPGDAP